jgi:hypothetical protein
MSKKGDIVSRSHGWRANASTLTHQAKFAERNCGRLRFKAGITNG